MGRAGLLGNLLLDDVRRAVAERTLLLDELLELRNVLLHSLDAARVVVARLVDGLADTHKNIVRRGLGEWGGGEGCALSALQTLVT